MAANKPSVSEKNLILILGIAFIALVVISANANSKLKSVIDSNESISESIVGLNNKMTEMGDKTLTAISEISKQRIELEDLRKKLTQERLKNVQLQGEVEVITSQTANTPAAAPAPEAPVSSNPVN